MRAGLFSAVLVVSATSVSMAAAGPVSGPAGQAIQLAALSEAQKRECMQLEQRMQGVADDIQAMRDRQAPAGEIREAEQELAMLEAEAERKCSGG